MAHLAVTVGKAPVDIGVALSAAIAAENPVGPMSTRGRGAVSLFNSSGNASLYVHIGESAPDESIPPVRVRPGEWYVADDALQVRPAADGGDRIWAWATRDDASITAVVTQWSI